MLQIKHQVIHMAKSCAGLLITYVALNLMDTHGLPALLYIVPFTLVDLPMGLMSEFVGEEIGNFIGKFLEYDKNNSVGVRRLFMRIRVSIDVRKPLKRKKLIKKSEEEMAYINFKYERLGNFCYICGILGHIERFCEKLFRVPAAEITREWGAW